MSSKPSQSPSSQAIALNEKALKGQAQALKARNITFPTYDRQNNKQGIVHIGVGGFHRAHLAFYIDQLMQKHALHNWAICGVGIQIPDKNMRDALVPQDGLYTLVERSQDGETAHIVGSLTSFIYAPGNCEAVFEKMAHPDTRIVSLTVTESGYFRNDSTGSLDTTHQDVAHDLKDTSAPKTVYGYLYEALLRRYKGKRRPFTVMSCDNMPQNGHTLRQMFIEFAQLRDKNFAKWIAEEVAFPNSMVDRITPRTTDDDKLKIKQTFGIDDKWPVVCEPFIQWVIEDNFSDGRPPWEKVGIQVVSDVEPFELMKLRLLNASHSAMGYLGYLAGFTYIHEVISDPLFYKYIKNMMHQEVKPLLPHIPGVDVNEYCETLLQRFANPTIKDQLPRICMSGSGKMPKFILPSISDQLKNDQPNIRRLTLCVASWFRYLTGFDKDGRPFEIDDVMADELRTKARQGADKPDSLLGVTTLFSPDLRQSKVFIETLTQALQLLYRDGAMATLAKYVE